MDENLILFPTVFLHVWYHLNQLLVFLLVVSQSFDLFLLFIDCDEGGPQISVDFVSLSFFSDDHWSLSAVLFHWTAALSKRGIFLLLGQVTNVVFELLNLLSFGWSLLLKDSNSGLVRC